MNDKKIVIAITSFFLLAAVIYSLLLPNIYESKALLSPVGEQVSSNQSMKNLGGLASLAGIDISNQGGGNSAKAIEKLGTLFSRKTFCQIFFFQILWQSNLGC